MYALVNLNFRSYDWHDGREGSDQCIIFGTLTPTNEMFLWEELKIPHATNTTEKVVAAISEKSGNLKYTINLIDPYANKIQAKCNTTVVDDMNRQFRELRNKGIGKGGHWESWDSKSTFGLNLISIWIY